MIHSLRSVVFDAPLDYTGSWVRKAGWLSAGEVRTMTLGAFDYAWIAAYLAVVLEDGWYLKQRTRTSGNFFLAGRSIPAWAAALAFISANCGATEMVGIAACGAKYGMLTSHFYWLARSRRWCSWVCS